MAKEKKPSESKYVIETNKRLREVINASNAYISALSSELHRLRKVLEHVSDEANVKPYSNSEFDKARAELGKALKPFTSITAPKTFL